MKLTLTQTVALDALEDNVTTEVLFGGAAGGGKSALGCYWQLKNRFKYPGSRGLIGRAEFKTLKDTTLKTFFEIAKKQGLKRGNHFDLTGSWDKENPNCIVFANSGLIYLRDLADTPSDPEFDELGSLEITDCYIDEVAQISQKAKDTLRTRLRYGLNEFGLIPKSLYSTNPNKLWAYHEFYKPWKDGTLSVERKFIPSLIYDNPNAPQAYIRMLEGLSPGAMKSRLLDGNWEYDADPATLIEYEKILGCFTNNFESLAGKRFITADVARYGADDTVIAVWNGFRCRLYVFHGLGVDQVAEKIKEFQRTFGVPNNHTLVDSDGVGGGVCDILKCKQFLNGSKPLPAPINPAKDEKGNKIPENYENLKSQCSFRMAARINNDGIFIEGVEQSDKDKIIKEMEQVKDKDPGGEGKKGVVSKEKVKEILKHSPDRWDAIMMREWVELKPPITSVGMKL